MNQKVLADTSHRMGDKAITTNEDGLRDEQVRSSHVSTDSINTIANLQPKENGQVQQNNLTLFLLSEKKNQTISIL